MHGPIQYLRQYPTLRLAAPNERLRARSLRDRLMTAADDGKWRDLEAAAKAGYHTHPAPRKPGDRMVHYFHAEHPPEPRRGQILDVHRPKALIYANVPGRPLVLVGAMWTTRPDERGPTPGGPITRWHSHISCMNHAAIAHMTHANSLMDVLREGHCPAGKHLHIGRVEMMHIWFTRDLRSAFAIKAPEPELCAARLLPATHC
jgi:hypothetical protein